jgi:hypothetical protein
MGWWSIVFVGFGNAGSEEVVNLIIFGLSCQFFDYLLGLVNFLRGIKSFVFPLKHDFPGVCLRELLRKSMDLFGGHFCVLIWLSLDVVNHVLDRDDLVLWIFILIVTVINQSTDILLRLLTLLDLWLIKSQIRIVSLNWTVIKSLQLCQVELIWPLFHSLGSFLVSDNWLSPVKYLSVLLADTG